MITGLCQIDSYRWYSRAAVILRNSGICVLGWLLGMSLVGVLDLPAQMLIAIGTGLLLLIFPVAPAGFLLAYLVGLPFLDALIPFFTVDLSGLRFGPQILFRGGLIVLLACYWLINQRNPLALRPAIPMLVLLLLLAISTAASGIRVRLGFITLARHVYWMLFLLTVADMVEQGSMKLRTIYRFVIVSTLCFMIIVIASPFIGIDRGSFYDIGDARGPYGSHSLAMCLCLGFIVALALYPIQKKRFYQSILLLFCMSAAISIARTYARTGYLSFFTTLSAFTLSVWRYGHREPVLRQYRAPLSLIFIVIIGTFSVYLFAHAEAFRKRTRDLSSIETAGSGRTIIYSKALKKYSDSSFEKQVFGGGLGDMYFLLGSELKVPHNDYLVILLAGGLAGLALHFWLLVALWRQIELTAQDTYLPLIIAGCAMAMFAVSTMTNPVIGYMSVMTYLSFLVGGAMGHYRRFKCERASESEGTEKGVSQVDRPYTKS